MSDLVERLLRGSFDARCEAVTALTAKDKEIETKTQAVADMARTIHDLQARAETAERERDEARAALKPFLPDPTMMNILWGDMDDEATGTHTVKLKHFRAARAVIKQGE